MKISSTVSTQTSLAGGTLVGPRLEAPPSLDVLLFGKRPARRVDPRRYPGVKKGRLKVEYLVGEVAELLGHHGAEFTVSLAEGSNASISRDGELRVGVGLLEQRQDDDDFLVALVGHELGHQPWDWPNENLSHLSPAQLNALYRREEAKADDFMGKALAELGARPDSMARFLLAAAQFEKTPPLDYDPAPQRVETIEASYRSRLLQVQRRRLVRGKKTYALR